MKKALLCLTFALMGTVIVFAQRKGVQGQFLSKQVFQKALSIKAVPADRAPYFVDGKATTPRLQRRAAGECTIVFQADDVWGDGSGYQMLLSSNALGFDAVSAMGFSDESYAYFDYKIPENAGYNATSVVIGQTVTITIPAGTYDWVVTNPTDENGSVHVYLPGKGNINSYADNFEFEAGNSYEFTVSAAGQGDQINYTINGEAPSVLKYRRPVGTFFDAGTYTGSDGAEAGYYYLQAPNGVPVTFINMSDDPTTAVWTYDGENGATALTEGVDDEGNYTTTFDPLNEDYLTPLPYLSRQNSKGQTKTFFISDGAYDGENGYVDLGQDGVYVPRDISLMGVFDDVRGDVYFGYSGPSADMPAHFGFGGIYPYTVPVRDEGGNVVRDDEGYVVYEVYTNTNGDAYYPSAIYQKFEKPASPLYIEEVYMRIYTDKINGEYKPIPEGTQVIMQFRSVAEDGSVGSEVFGTFYCGSEDATINGNFEKSNYNIGYGVASFANTTTDEYGIETLQGVVIDQPFYIVVAGLDQTGVDMGFALIDMGNVESEQPFAECVTEQYACEDGSGQGLRVTSSYTTYFYLSGIMDNIQMVGTTWQRINEQDMKAYDDDGSREPADYMLFIPTRTWIGSEQAEGEEEPYTFDNYTLVFNDGTGESIDAPEWLNFTVSRVYDSGSIGGDDPDLMQIFFSANNNLSSNRAADGNIIETDGRKGRFCAVTIETLTGTSEPMYIIQGDLTHEDVLEALGITDGIQTVNAQTKPATSAKGMYNITGQRVNHNYRGIVIENGKKLIKK